MLTQQVVCRMIVLLFGCLVFVYLLCCLWGFLLFGSFLDGRSVDLYKSLLTVKCSEGSYELEEDEWTWRLLTLGNVPILQLHISPYVKWYNNIYSRTGWWEPRVWFDGKSLPGAHKAWDSVSTNTETKPINCTTKHQSLIISSNSTTWERSSREKDFHQTSNLYVRLWEVSNYRLFQEATYYHSCCLPTTPSTILPV